jgi:hypothetical protein
MMTTFIESDATRRETACHNNNGMITRCGNCCGEIIHLWDHATTNWIIPDHSEFLICIKKRNTFYWSPLTELSGDFFLRYKEYIRNHINGNQLSALNTRIAEGESRLAELHAFKNNTLMLIAMYQEMSIEKKKEIMNTQLFKQSILHGNICGGCYAYTEEIHKCIHVDCPGCCSACQQRDVRGASETPTSAATELDNGENKVHLMCKVCPACHKKQELQCPICFEVQSAANLCLIGCRHAFCWKCYGLSCMKGSQITKCPMCREEITKVIET